MISCLNSKDMMIYHVFDGVYKDDETCESGMALKHNSADRKTMIIITTPWCKIRRILLLKRLRS